jgi:DNA polymerase II large subunit
MGRPEKSKMRKLQGSPQVLFPVGEEGGRMRSFQSSIEKGEVTSDFPLYYCDFCQKHSIFGVCHRCMKATRKAFFCPSLNKEIFSDDPPIKMDENCKSYRNITINIKEYVDSCLKLLDTKVYPDLIKGVKGTSNKDHIPEHLLKGFLRAKHDIYVNKDGTTRYDMSEAPITAFKPKEIGTSLEKLRNLGYIEDMDGNKLERDDQLLELFPQDLILPAGENTLEEQADEIIFRVGNFVDELLQKLYRQKKHYKFKSKEDIVGSLIICLAPHISCGTIGRVIGFSRNQVMLAHPMMHAALRRDCDGDEACFIMLMDAFLNFSRQYLPDKRGTRTMDAPLVLSMTINPSEVDDQVHGLDVVKRYPIELYEASLRYEMPWAVKVEQLNVRLGKEEQYERFNFTHPVHDINTGPKISAYKTLASMQEKLNGQMKLAYKLRAVDAPNVASMVIQKHFLKDIKGNLRKFSHQQFRCVKCNTKYTRPPLVGKCTACGGKLIFTISEGSVIKYLEPSMKLIREYGVPPYLKQTLELTQERVNSVFGKEKEIQEGLSKFI